MSSAEEICVRAVEVGLKGLALTEHNRWWPFSEFVRLQQRFADLTLMRGVEYGCPEGHFLVFLPNPEKAGLPSLCSVVDLIPLVHNHGGIVIWAHPFRFDKTWPSWLDWVELDGVEIASSNMHRQNETAARNVAARKKIMAFRNSDAHHLGWLGRFSNDLDISLNCTEDFIAFVKQSSRKSNRKPGGVFCSS